MDWQIPLAISAGAFAAVLVWRLRPNLAGREKPSHALKDAKAAVDSATSDDERAEALAKAGDASAALVGRGGSAVGYYLRAMRLQPDSVALVRRAVTALERKPLALEALLWRRLGVEDWSDKMRPTIVEIVRGLSMLYSRGPLRRRLRARAFANLLRAFGESP
jgi:hypothetical protein